MLQLRQLIYLAFSGGLMDYLRVCISSLLLSFSTLISAGTVTGLYSVELATTADKKAPTEAQILQGLKQVLVKVSGSRELDKSPAVQQKFVVAETLLQQFSFRKNLEDETAAFINLQYAQGAIDRLIKQAGIKPLGPQRPKVLFWVVSDSKGLPDYLPSESFELSVLNRAARSRGLPIQLPLLDPSDQAALPANDIWDSFEGSIKAASARYNADAIAAVKLQYSDSGNVALGGMLIVGSTIEFLSVSGDVNTVLNNMVDKVADQLFQPVVSYKLSHFQTGIAMKVSGVASLSDYSLLTAFLRGLPVVKDLKPERVNGNEVTLRLQLDGTEQQLIQAIKMELRLNATEQVSNPNGNKVLSYRWQG